MVEDDIDLANLECVGIGREKHFLDNPAVLQCGHFMCFTCVHSEKDDEDIVKCGICQEDKTVNFKMNPATLLVNEKIKTCLSKLFDVVQQKCKSTLSQLRSTYMETKESIELQFEYIKEEIEIRAESLKNEINELCRTIYSDLQVQKELNLKNTDAIYNEVRNCENDLENNEDLKFVDKKTENLTNIQGKLEMLNQLKHDLLNSYNKISLTTTEGSIDTELITHLDYNDKNKKPLIIPSTFKKVIPIHVKGLHLCVIPEDQLIVSDYVNQCILVFDKDMKPVKKVEEINRHSFEPYATATNESNMNKPKEKINFNCCSQDYYLTLQHSPPT